MDSKDFIKRVEELKKLGGHPGFYDLLLQIAELHARKNHDYAQNQDPLSNLKWCANFDISPFKGVLVRLSDKWSRITELSKKEAMVASESIKDTLLDNAVYSLLAIILYEDEQAERQVQLTKPTKIKRP